MSLRNVFKSEVESTAYIVTPLRNVSEFTEESVSDELKIIRREFGDSPVKHVVFDFRAVQRISSAMLEILLTMKRELDSSGKMACCNVPNAGQEVLKLCRFDTFVSICTSRQEALEAVDP